jgi:hypothetical protein
MKLTHILSSFFLTHILSKKDKLADKPHSVTEAISEDLERQGACLKELHIDRAYLSSHLVRERNEELEVYVPRLAGS